MKLQSFIKYTNQNPFYNDLCAYLSSGPIVVMILEGKNAVLANRKNLWEQQILKMLKKIQLENCMAFQLIKKLCSRFNSVENAEKGNKIFF